ncbi:MAG: beta-lactamase family protein [Roseiflexaceae bacterium]|nr:beta-lactamase family protein [Roseiflexaceae bacterium]
MQSYPTLDRTDLTKAFDLTAHHVQTGRVATAVLAVASATDVLQSAAYAAPDGMTIDGDSIFLLASLSKPILGLAVMQLVEAGVLDLSQPVRHYLPEFDTPDKAAITAWHLLTHTSGIEEVNWATALQQRPQQIVSFSAACQAVSRFPPGSRVLYSTLTFYVLAELLARLSGEPYPHYLARHIFAPLGMQDTSFDPRAEARRTVPLIGINAGQPLSIAEATDFFLSFAMPGAGLWSSAHDLIALGQALLQTYQRQRRDILSPAFLELMTRDHTRDIPHATQERGAHYGLTWRKGQWAGYQTVPASPTVFEHDGASGCLLWIDPSHDLVVVYLTNDFNADSTVRNGALQCVYRALR